MMAWPTLISPEAHGPAAQLTTPLCPDLGPRSPRVGWPEGVAGPDGQPLKVEQAKALAELERALPPWVELRDAEGTLIALTAEGPGAGAGFASAVDAKRRNAEVFADRGQPYFQRDDPRHAHAVEEVRRLFESAYG